MNRKILIDVVIILIAFLFLLSSNRIYASNSGNITDQTIGKIQKKWILLKDKTLEFEPRLKHYVWELQMPPYIKDYDKIRLHRLVNTVSKPKAVVFIFPATFSSGEQIISEQFLLNSIKSANKHMDDYPDIAKDLLSEINTIHNRSIAHLLALDGYDVYSMDYRTHFVHKDLQPDELGFMSEWGWKMFMDDTKPAIMEVKNISGHNKMFIAGESFGGMLAMNYASVHWEEDLMGIILLDGGNGGKWRLRIPANIWKMVEFEFMKNIPEMPEWSIVDGKIMPTILQALIDVVSELVLYDMMDIFALDCSGGEPAGGLTEDISSILENFLTILGIPYSFGGGISNYAEVQKAAFEDILAAPEDPITGKPLKPYNDETGKPFRTYMEWLAELESKAFPQGSTTNYKGGENTSFGISLISTTFDRYWPLPSYLESIKMFEVEITTSEELLDIIGIKIDFPKLPLAVKETIKALYQYLGGKTPSALVNEPGIKPEIKLKELLDKSYEKMFSAQNYSKRYKDIDIPLISFESKFGLMLWGPFTPGIKSSDVTNGGEFINLGHFDIFIGSNNYELVNKPTLDWLRERSLPYQQ